MKSGNLYSEKNQNLIDNEVDKHLHNLSMNSGDKVVIYNKWAGSYDKYVQNEHYCAPRNLVSIVMENLTPQKTMMNILDFGCGTGLVGKELNAAFKARNMSISYNLTGIDISQGMIDESKKLGVYNNLVCNDIVDKDLKITDVRKITSTSDGFDLIVSCGVFLEGHVSLDAIPRVLFQLLNKSGGVLAVTIRDSFLNKSPNFKSDLDALECRGLKIVHFKQIEYLRGVSAWLLMISKNNI